MTTILTKEESKEYRIFEVDYQICKQKDLNEFLSKFNAKDTIYCEENKQLYVYMGDDDIIVHDAQIFPITKYGRKAMFFVREMSYDKYGAYKSQRIVPNSDMENYPMMYAIRDLVEKEQNTYND